MRLLLDENMPAFCVEKARSRGHSVKWVRDLMPGAADDVILDRMRETGETLVTRDVRFANLCFSLVSASRLSSPVVLIKAQVLVDLHLAWDLFLDRDTEPPGIVVVSPRGVRIRRAREQEP